MLALEGAEHQGLPLQQIKTDPVDVSQLLIEQRGQVRQVGNQVGFTLQQSLGLLVEGAIKCLFFNHD